MFFVVGAERGIAVFVLRQFAGFASCQLVCAKVNSLNGFDARVNEEVIVAISNQTIDTVNEKGINDQSEIVFHDLFDGVKCQMNDRF